MAIHRFGGCVLLAVSGLAVSCGPSEKPHDFIDTAPVRGSVEGLWNFPGNGSLPDILGASEALVLAEVTDVAATTTDLASETPPAWIPQAIRDTWGLPYTTYTARVEEWLKGSGPEEITITDVGGLTADGPVFLNGDFLLQVGRKYVVSLGPNQGMPGGGQYSRSSGGRGSFEVTDGYVHVLNHPLAQDLQQQWGGMALADFVRALQGLVAATPAPNVAP